MLGAAYAYRTLALSDARRNAARALHRVATASRSSAAAACCAPHCWGNLKLVDALAVLVDHRRRHQLAGSGGAARPIRSPRAGRRRAHRSTGASARSPTTRSARLSAAARLRGTVLSDPPADPLAYHALTTFMLREAVTQLGPRASRSARRAMRETLDALSVLISPDGDTSYLGRGQGQTWVPAIAAAALAGGARDIAAAQPVRAGRYLAGAQRAIQRLAALHAGPQGLQVVPGALARTTTAGIDAYAHTVAYNGLALFGAHAGARLARRDPGGADRPAARRPAPRRAATSAPAGWASSSNGRVWLAVHKTATDANDLRHDFGCARAQAPHAGRMGRPARAAPADEDHARQRRPRADAPRTAAQAERDSRSTRTAGRSSSTAPTARTSGSSAGRSSAGG